MPTGVACCVKSITGINNYSTAMVKLLVLIKTPTKEVMGQVCVKR